MLTLADRKLDRNCQGFARREFLRIGMLGFGGGLTLANLLAGKAAAAASNRSYVRDRSVVLLFLQGGPSHIECFDPKMTAPAEFRSITSELPTSLPGITFGGTYPQLASLAHKLAVVRSYGSKNSGHTYESVTAAQNPTKASMGAIYARVAGTNHPRTGIPSNILILPEAIDPKVPMGRNFETGALPTLTPVGELGPSYAAFNAAGGGQLREDMTLSIASQRLSDRRHLIENLDRMRRMIDHSGVMEGIDKYRQQAFDVITGSVAEAFDLSKENPKTVARYDTQHLFRIEDVQRWGDMRRSTNLLGKQLLLARRLCEAGCGFVTVSDCGWDMHSNGNSPKHLAGMYWLGPQVDHAVAAFIQDVEERGLSDKILLVVTGEMGRGPRINNNGGRDHYGELTPLALYGGGLKMGQIVGASDAHAATSATEPYNPSHLMATIFHTLFDVTQMRLDPSIPRDLVRLMENGQPIAPLMA